MRNKLLLTTSVYPFPSLPQNEAATDVMGQRFTRGNDIFTMVSHTHAIALHLLAQNLQFPSVVLEYPRWKQFSQEVAKGYCVIGISAYPFHLDSVLEMCRHIRKTSPQTRILVGSYAAQTLKALGGLEKYGDLIDDLVDEEGVSYLRRLFGEDTQRPVNQHFFPKNGAGMRYFGKKPRGHTVLLFSGLGCPGSCDFCSSSAQYKRKRIELLSPKELIEHVRHYLTHSPNSIQQFYLIDEDHFRFPEYLLQLRTFIGDDPSFLGKADFVVFGSVDYIARFAQKYGWEAIAEAGIGAIFIGVESRTAGGHGYRKRHSYDAKEVFEQLHRIGVRTIGAWIAGFSFQTRQTLLDDLHYFISCKPTYQQLSIFSAFPGTPLHASLEERGAAPRCQFSDYHFWNPTSSHPEFSNRELLELTDHGYTLGYETWGPCLLRNLEVHLNGIQFCRESPSAILRNHTALLHRKNADKIYTQLRAMAKFAPNMEVQKRIGAVEQRYRDLLGGPTLAIRLLSQASLALAILYKFKISFHAFRWTPKVEGFRRYRYNPGIGTPNVAHYAVERR
jgi:hypothetical protein